jgi:hypothetical protein
VVVPELVRTTVEGHEGGGFHLQLEIPPGRFRAGCASRSWNITLVEYINTGDELHLAHNFVFFHLPWQAAAVRASVQEFTDLTERAA